MSETDEVKSRLDIVNIISEYVPLKKAGKNYRGNCPFHSENTPSFMVSQELQIYKCFGCGEGGDMFTFVEKMEGFDFKEALNYLAQKAGVEIKQTASRNENAEGNKNILFEINELSAKFYAHLLTKHKIGTEALKYATQKRGLTEETIEIFRLGYAPAQWDALYKFLVGKGYQEKDLLKAGVVVPNKNGTSLYDKFRDRLVFPLIAPDGKVLGFGGRSISNAEPKYLNSQETSIFHKENFLYGLAQNKLVIRDAGILLVEGYMDVVSAYQHGIKNAVASCGTSLTSAQLKLASRYSKDITICFDNDSAGITAAVRASQLADAQNLNPRIARIPKPHKDLDDLVKQEPNAVQKILEASLPYPQFVIASIVERNDKNSSIGKKKILSETGAFFRDLKNPVDVDHYIRALSQDLELDSETVKQFVKSPNLEELDLATNPREGVIKNLEDYAIALLLGAHDLDKSHVFLENLTPDDFSVPLNSKLFGLIKDQVTDQGSLDQKSLIKSASGEESARIKELALLDLSDLTDERLLKEEGLAIYKRIKQESSKRKAKDLTNKIKEAEKLGNEKELKALVEKFKKLQKES